MHTINEAMKSRDTEVKKGAEIMLAMAPNVLFRSPNVGRDLSTRAKWTIRFTTFWAGDFASLINDIPSSSYSTLQREGI